MKNRVPEVADRPFLGNACHLCGVFQTVAYAHGMGDDPLPVLQEMVVDVEKRINAGEDVLEVSLDIMMSSNDNDHLHVLMGNMGLDDASIAQVKRIEGRISDGPLDSEEESLRDLQMLRMMDIFAEACVTKFGETTTGSLIPGSMKVPEMVDIYDRYHLPTFKKLTI